MITPAPVLVSVWGELRGERPLPGRRRVPVLRVLVDGQYAGALEWDGHLWHAAHQARALSKPRETEHPTAPDAVRTVLRSGLARRVGARAASPVYWTDRARRAVARTGGEVQ